MVSALDKLRKMISLEIEQEYENKAVIGGLECILAWWPEQARVEYRSPEQGAIIQELATLLAGYGAVKSSEVRAQTIAEIQEKLVQIETHSPSNQVIEPPKLPTTPPETDVPPSTLLPPLRQMPKKAARIWGWNRR